jgi:hypothetical protein
MLKRLSPDMLTAYQNYDFATLLTLVNAALQNAQTSAADKQLLEQIQPGLVWLSSLRSDIATAAKARPGAALYSHPTLGPISLIGADDTGLIVQSGTGSKHQAWNEVTPAGWIVMARSLLSRDGMREKTDGMMQLYAGLPGQLPPPPEGNPPGGATGPMGGGAGPFGQGRGPQAGGAMGGPPPQGGAAGTGAQGQPPPRR